MIEEWISEHGEWLLAGGFVLGFVALLLRQHIINNAPTYTAFATVIAHRMEPAKYHSRWSSGWNHLVVFRLSDGEELELHTGEMEYDALEEGMTGQLCWQGSDFREFDTN